MKNEFDILFDIIDRFNEINIPYMLTGSLAMNYYAEPRMTRDIDFIVVMQPKMKVGLIQKFKDDYYISEKAFNEAIKYNSMFNIIHKQSVIKADLIIRKNSEYRENEFNRRKKVIIQGHSIFIVSKEDLIISKIFWSRESKSEIQKRDIINLLNDNYDKKYLIKWLKKIELYNFAKEFVGEIRQLADEMRKLYHKMLMKKSGEERFLMGISLCETARKMVLASFPDNINEDEKHVKLLLRYYKNEFPTNEMNKIVANIKAKPTSSDSSFVPIISGLRRMD